VRNDASLTLVESNGVADSTAYELKIQEEALVMESMIKDVNLAEAGEIRIEWARRHMPVLEKIKDEFARDKPLDNIPITACSHVTVETANLIRALQSGGASVALAGSNPLSTQDDVAAALAKSGVTVCAFRGARHHAF
jgi:adenosylhomocysteinase